MNNRAPNRPRPDAEDQEALGFAERHEGSLELFTVQDLARLRRGLVQLAIHIASLEKTPDLYIFPDTSARVLIDLCKPVLTRLQKDGLPPRIRSLASDSPRAQHMYLQAEKRMLKEYPGLYEYRTEDELHKKEFKEEYTNLRLQAAQDTNRMYSFKSEVDQDREVGSILVVDEYSGRNQNTIRYLLNWLRDGFPGADVRGFSFLGQQAVQRKDHLVPLVDLYGATADIGDPVLDVVTGTTTDGFSYRNTLEKKALVTGVQKHRYGELTEEMVQEDSFVLPKKVAGNRAQEAGVVLRKLGDEVIDRLIVEGFFDTDKNG